MEHHWSYDLLKHIAINDKLAQENLEELKALFKDEIGSTRNVSRIKNMDNLIDCLERRDALSEANIEPFREIADQFADIALEEAVSHYIRPNDTTAYTEPYNQYREVRLAEELRTNLTLNGQRCADDHGAADNGGYPRVYHLSQQPAPPQPPAPTPYAQALTDKKRTAIFKVISENIGKFWRALGRELEITQGKMDELEMQYPRDLVSRVHKMLHVFEEDESQDPNRFVLTLCRGLEECRRKDLRRKVEEIMSH